MSGITRASRAPYDNSFSAALCRVQHEWDHGGLSWSRKAGAAFCAARILRIGLGMLKWNDSPQGSCVEYRPTDKDIYAARLTSKGDAIEAMLNQCTAVDTAKT